MTPATANDMTLPIISSVSPGTLPIIQSSVLHLRHTFARSHSWLAPRAHPDGISVPRYL